MRVLPLKVSKTFKPPFVNDLEDLLTWLKPITVVCKGNITCGGAVLSANIIATTAALFADNIVVQLPNGKHTRAKRIDYETDLFLSFFEINVPVSFIGLPTWTLDDELDEDTKFFSYIPFGKERFVMFKTIALEDSKAAGYCEETEKTSLVITDVEHTFPVVDQYGYFVGLGIGTSFDECIVLRFVNKKAKL